MSGNVKKIAALVILIVVGLPVAFWYSNQDSPEVAARKERARAAREQRDAGQTATKKTANPAAAKGEADQVESQFDVADVDIDALRQNIRDVDFEYNLERLSRDPLSPLIGLQAAAGASTDSSQPQIGADERLIQTARLKAISGIVWDDASPFAVIDNEVVTQGFTYPEGIVVDEILPDHVVFRVNNARVEVELKEQ